MLYRTNKLIVSVLLLVFIIICGALDVSAAGKKYLIAIDPAHGGSDTGVKIKDKLAEKDITLAIALSLRKELATDNNYEIVLTRDAEKEISIEDRKKNIIQLKPDVLLSLHINSGFSKNATGFEIYYPGLNDLTNQKKRGKDGQKDVKNKYLDESARLAQIIQKKLDALFPRKGRGVREAETPILEGLAIPAVVVEIGFASNPEDRKNLLLPNSQSEIAKALAKSINLFFNR